MVDQVHQPVLHAGEGVDLSQSAFSTGPASYSPLRPTSSVASASYSVNQVNTLPGGPGSIGGRHGWRG